MGGRIVTPMQVLHRSGLLPKIAQTGDGLVAYDELRPGDLIRLGGDWLSITAIRSDGILRLRDENGSPCWYPSSVGERFTRSGGF